MQKFDLPLSKVQRYLQNNALILKQVKRLCVILLLKKWRNNFAYRVSEKLCHICIAAVEELKVQYSRILHSNIGQALTPSLIPCWSRSETWLMIHGREMAT